MTDLPPILLIVRKGWYGYSKKTVALRLSQGKRSYGTPNLPGPRRTDSRRLRWTESYSMYRFSRFPTILSSPLCGAAGPNSGSLRSTVSSLDSGGYWQPPIYCIRTAYTATRFGGILKIRKQGISSSSLPGLPER